MDDLAADSINTLRNNYPNYPALNKDGGFNFNYNTKATSTWINTLSLGLLNSSKPPGFNNESLYNSSVK
jgi:outer membrane protein assembly factor BamD